MNLSNTTWLSFIKQKMNTSSQISVFEREISPFLQAGVALSGAFILMIAAKILRSAGLEFSERFPWMAAGAFLLLYSIFNAIFGLSARQSSKYYGKSVMAFLSLAFLSGLLAFLFSGISLDDAGSFSWIYLVLTLGYLVFLSMINLMKKIVEFAMREDWQHPRIRSKNRK